MREELEKVGQPTRRRLLKDFLDLYMLSPSEATVSNTKGEPPWLQLRSLMWSIKHFPIEREPIESEILTVFAYLDSNGKDSIQPSLTGNWTSYTRQVLVSMLEGTSG
jgi:hypothetical protein